MNTNETPWYKQFWPWFIMALPASAVVAGITTVIIANNNAVDLVNDKTTKLGKMVMRETGQDDLARSLQLEAQITLSPASGAVAIDYSGADQSIKLDLVHNTLAELDQSIVLIKETDGTYRGRLKPFIPGKWRLLLSAEDDAWRLLSSYDGVQSQIKLTSETDPDS